MKRPLLAFSLLLVLGACGASDPTVQTVTAPSLAVAPSALTLTAGTAPITLFASLAGAEAPLSWTLAGPGSLSATTGSSVNYAPPDETDAQAQATVTVRAADTSATVSITLNPIVTEWFVSPSGGSDENLGTAAKPFKTLTHALSVASSGQKVRLADGRYDADGGEVWPVTVPAGVLIEAAHAGGATLAGPSDVVALSPAGDVSLQGLVFADFQWLVAGGPTSTGVLTLKDVVLDGIGLSLAGAMQATLTDVVVKNLGPLMRALALSEASQVTMTGGSITGASVDADCRSGSGVSLHGATRAQFENVSIQQIGRVVDAQGMGAVSFTGSAIQNTFSCDTTVIFTLDAASVTLTDTSMELAAGNAIRVDGTAGTLRLTDVTVSTPGRCVSTAAESTVILRGTFSGCEVGLWSDEGRALVTDSEFTGNEIGILSSQGSTLTVRGTTIHDGERALSLYPGVDLGTVSSPGNNTFTASIQVLDLYGGGVTAMGNTWLPNTQGSDALGRYTTQTLTGPVTGLNFKLDADATLKL